MRRAQGCRGDSGGRHAQRAPAFASIDAAVQTGNATTEWSGQAEFRTHQTGGER